MSSTPYLVVYPDKSVLFDSDQQFIFEEGISTSIATQRLQKLKSELDNDFLVNVIEECKKPDALNNMDIENSHLELLKRLTKFTSEVGRALVGLTILQLCVKSIIPEQSIRLHKSSKNKSGFSWAEGIPMRTIDKNYITPTLRKYGLLSLNADGFMMTRSLAENYPYSKVYKAAIRGHKQEWLEIVDLLETSEMKPKEALYHLITLLKNKSDNFCKMADITIDNLNTYLNSSPGKENILNLITEFVDSSSYSARIFEVSLHSLFQVFDEYKILPGTLKPLTQMRSANKKHGNIGDVEVINSRNSLTIFEAWDAKYGKPYLREELEELSEKLELHSETEVVGFVVNQNPYMEKEITEKIDEIKDIFNIALFIFSFDEWVRYQLNRINSYGVSEEEVVKRWVVALVESICQKRRNVAPLDEPCDDWVIEFNKLIQGYLKH